MRSWQLIRGAGPGTSSLSWAQLAERSHGRLTRPMPRSSAGSRPGSRRLPGVDGVQDAAPPEQETAPSGARDGAPPGP